MAETTLIREQIEAWRKWAKDGQPVKVYCGTMDQLCDQALRALSARAEAMEEEANICDELTDKAEREHGKPMKTWGSGLMSGRCSAFRQAAIAIRAAAGGKGE